MIINAINLLFLEKNIEGDWFQIYCLCEYCYHIHNKTIFLMLYTSQIVLPYLYLGQSLREENNMWASTPNNSDPIVNLPVKKLRRRYLTGLLLIAILVVISQLIMQSLLSSQTYDSNVINIAGRQRMLSQKITKLSYYILTEKSATLIKRHRNDLQKTLKEWESSHRGLLNGDQYLGLPDNNSKNITALFQALTPHYQAMVYSATKILSSNNPIELKENVEIISQHESFFLEIMDEIAFEYAKEAKAKVSFAVWIELFLMTLTIIALILEVFLIFAPAARSLQAYMNKLTQSKNDLQNLFAASPIAMLLVDPKTLSIMQVNEKAIDLIGDPFEVKDSAKLSDYLDPNFKNNNVFIHKLSQASSLNEYEIAILNAQGKIHETLISVRSITFDDKSISVIGITNISELKKAQKELFHYASFDDMTGLLNRRAGLVFLENAMLQIDKSNHSLSVCYIDLDGLKGVNDEYGHTQGDWLIQTASKVLIDIIQGNDAGVRLGGDEFLLILHDYSVADINLLISKITSSLDYLNKINEKPFALAFSYGIATYTDSQQLTGDELISIADNMMYQCKQAKKLAAKKTQ
ncbi:MAG: diguanylate cyclase domain-containing protein [Marinomonas sp.]